jgi:phosphoglucosamine mutase
MKQQLFGTDGVRGKAGCYPLDPPTVRRLGAALMRALPGSKQPRKLLIGRDTRESGTWIERELAHGAGGTNAVVVSAGIISTPAIAFLASAMGFDLGAVISASHNPFEDNGIKVFSGGGEKFTEELETRVEEIVGDHSWQVPGGEAPLLTTQSLDDAYLAHVVTAFSNPERLEGRKVVIDCANGATYRLAPRLFRAIGLDVTALGCSPDGRNINLGCGSTHPQQLSEVVRRDGYELGIAFDGDGDRAIFVDGEGKVVDGDAVMHMCALRMKQSGRLRGDAIVATVMSNIGLELALKKNGIALVRSAVGDKYVMQEMVRRDLSLGGEQSGHIIFSDYLFTGDGLITALQVLQTIADTGKSLAELAARLVTYPQVLVNVRVGRKADLRSIPEIAAAIADVERRLSGHGRLLVRYSGTEPLLRIMLEGRDRDEIESWAHRIADLARHHLGGIQG